jgi:hypothetical protein
MKARNVDGKCGDRRLGGTMTLGPTKVYALVVASILVVATSPCLGEELRPRIVVFDGRGTNLFVNSAGGTIDWPVENGALVSTPNGRRSNNLISRVLFCDVEVHVEFLLPPNGDGNSGVYVHGLYELQILNSKNTHAPAVGGMGAIYGLHAPAVDASLPPGEWQALDIVYHAPRCDTDGKIVTEGTISARLNGRQIHDGATISAATSAYNPFAYDATPFVRELQERQEQRSIGPLILQDHDCPVRFRNIWIRPLDDRATVLDLTEDTPEAERTPSR